jgi:hypothetical protein
MLLELQHGGKEGLVQFRKEQERVCSLLALAVCPMHSGSGSMSLMDSEAVTPLLLIHKNSGGDAQGGGRAKEVYC